MDQLPDLLTSKHYFEVLNLTDHSLQYLNLSEAQHIIQDFEHSLVTVNQFTTVILLTLYIPVFLIGLVGNILIVVSVSADKVRKAKLYFLVNLAFSDLAVTVLCMPTSIGTSVYRLWVYGRFLCKFSAFIQGRYHSNIYTVLEYGSSVWDFHTHGLQEEYEPPHGKTNNLHMRTQRRRSASR